MYEVNRKTKQYILSLIKSGLNYNHKGIRFIYSYVGVNVKYGHDTILFAENDIIDEDYLDSIIYRIFLKIKRSFPNKTISSINIKWRYIERSYIEDFQEILFEKQMDELAERLSKFHCYD